MTQETPIYGNPHDFMGHWDVFPAELSSVVLRDETMDRDGVLLADAVCAVRGLPVARLSQGMTG